ncbi:nitrate/nitrite porter [Cantharellus anzutake]|uniref:nitrate/nitrite porter n=1 Tax=Cantharellus anzutake TaxID=1750568 RepID=UPI00190723A2|nr:nitrate/nitrite porter [Cantharellus anzutake]KAF8329332.1 nitrate/nitrite porter [Cantharellus anzutake]
MAPETSPQSENVVASPHAQLETDGPPPFKFSSLWEREKLNPINLKSYTLPIFNLKSPYARNFHLSWLAFHVAFLSWFAFPPLLPEAIKADLKLTSAQVGNSNIVALSATLIVRMIAGPLVDRFGPRKVMAAILILGAIPSGLAGTVHSVQGLYAVRFFIGILGGTFVPCQAWTTAFFDKNCVGRANALVGGWGNAGGGTTFVIMVALFSRLTRHHSLSPHSAWRVAFAIVPVPALLFVAVLTLVFGTDHPKGKWSERHKPIASLEVTTGASRDGVVGEKHLDAEQGATVHVQDLSVPPSKSIQPHVLDFLGDHPVSEVDVAINQNLTSKMALEIAINPLTWLPALAYLTTFGFELALDSSMANILFSLYKSPHFGQTKAGYFTSIVGLMNVWTRPFGGYLGDVVYRRFGVPGKKVLSLAMGFYIDSTKHPDLTTVIAILTILVIPNEMGNGANFSLVPHCNAYSNGFMSGIVGAFGNMGGIFFALIFRFQPLPLGKALWISGIIAIVVNALLIPIRVPRY